jgi:cytosine deaminase
MRTVIAGGHGQIALRLERLLAARGDSSAGLIRNPVQADDLRAVGAEPVVLDLESARVDEVAAVLEGADAAVFAAGAGAGSGAARKQTVDHAAAVRFADAAERAGVRRFLVVSSMGADADAGGADPVLTAYLRAKGQADDAIRTRTALDWTILRPGALTNTLGTSLVTLSTGHTGRGSVPREDVATTLAALLITPGTAGLTLELISGSTPVPEAVAQVARG